MDDNSLNNIAKSLQNFAKTTVKLGAIMNDISRNVIPAVQSFSAAAEQIGEAIRNAIPFEKLQKLADVLTSIPSDIQETQLYADALGLSRVDLHYEDIADWLDLFQMHSSRDVKKALAGLTFPTNSVEEYVTRTIYNSRIPKREDAGSSGAHRAIVLQGNRKDQNVTHTCKGYCQRHCFQTT